MTAGHFEDSRSDDFPKKHGVGVIGQSTKDRGGSFQRPGGAASAGRPGTSVTRAAGPHGEVLRQRLTDPETIEAG